MTVTDQQRAEWRARAEFWTTRDPSTIGHLYDETAVAFAGEVLALLDALDAAEWARDEHFKARNLLLAQDDAWRAKLARVKALSEEWEQDYPSSLAACSRESDEWWIDLRAALAGPSPTDEGGEGA